jgi:hypothetical protein
MSLVNEAIFEASFVGRDELIEAFRSKVALDTERKAVFFKEVINKIAPVKQYRSICASPLKRHQERNIIILPCWTKIPKWSLNIKRMLLDRSAGLSFRNRISLCSTGPFEGAIRLAMKPPSTGQSVYKHINILYLNIDTHTVYVGTGFYAKQPQLPALIIDQCGACSLPDPDETQFNVTLARWHVRRIFIHHDSSIQLGRSYEDRLLGVNKIRADEIKAVLNSEVDKFESTDKEQKPDPHLVVRKYNGYKAFHKRWPDHIPALDRKLDNQVQNIMLLRRQRGSVWNGDMEEKPDRAQLARMTIPELKAIIRYFQNRRVEHGLTLGGVKATLLCKVERLLRLYYQDP